MPKLYEKEEMGMNTQMPLQNDRDLTSHIVTLRGQKVIIDTDLARIYGVEPKVLNQAVKRNMERFPSDFMFALTREEWGDLSSLRSQIVTSFPRMWSQLATSYRRTRRA